MSIKWKMTEDGKLDQDENGNPIRVMPDGQERPVNPDDVSKANQESAKRKDKIAELEKRLAHFEGIDDPAGFIAEARKAMEAVANMPDKEKDIEEQVRARVEAQVKPFREQLEALEAKHKETARLYESEKISNAFTRSRYANEKLANLAMAQDLFSKHFTMKDGRIVAMKDGQPIYGADGEASFDEALAKLVEDSQYRDHLLKGSAASGSGAGQPGRHGSSAPNPWKTETRNVTEQQRILAENPSLAKTFMQQAGVPLPASMAKL